MAAPQRGTSSVLMSEMLRVLARSFAWRKLDWRLLLLRRRIYHGAWTATVPRTPHRVIGACVDCVSASNLVHAWRKPELALRDEVALEPCACATLATDAPGCAHSFSTCCPMDAVPHTAALGDAHCSQAQRPLGVRTREFVQRGRRTATAARPPSDAERQSSCRTGRSKSPLATTRNTAFDGLAS